MNKLLSITIVFVVILSAFNCKDQKGSQMVKAKIHFSGLLAADGCGWLLEIKGKEYSPVNLEENFQVDGLQVEAEVNFLGTGFQCGMNPDHKIPQLEIINLAHLSE